MAKSIIATCIEKVEAIYSYRSEEFLKSSLESFKLNSKLELSNEFKKIVVAYNKNAKTNKYNYFAQYLNEFQMSIFTTFETELKSLLGCSEAGIMISKYNI